MLAKHLWLFVALTPYRSGALRPDAPLLWRSAARPTLQDLLLCGLDVLLLGRLAAPKPSSSDASRSDALRCGAR